MAGIKALAEEAEKYKKAYFELADRVEKLLGPPLGLPLGPFPEICSRCAGGPCHVEAECAQEVMMGELTTEFLLEQAADNLGRLKHLLK